MAMRPDGGYTAAPQPSAVPVPNFQQAANQARSNLASGHGTLGDQATVMNGSAANLVAAAGSGFKISPEAATALIASCDEAIKVLDGVAVDVAYVQDAPRLGGTNVAQAVSSFTQQVAGDHQGIANGVMNLKATIAQMREAYQKAAANYHAIEHQISDSLTQLDNEVRQQNAPMPQHGRNRAV